MKFCLKTENGCLKTQTKHSLIFQKAKEIVEVNDSWMTISLLPFEQDNIEINQHHKQGEGRFNNQ